MKTLCIALALALPLICQAAPPTVGSVSLEVKQVASKRTEKNYYSNDYGSYDKDFARSRSIEVSVTTLSREPFNVIVKTTWIGKPVQGTEPLFLKQNERPVTVRPAVAEKWIEESGDVKSSDMNLKLIGERDTAGARIAGWLVVVRSESGAVLRVKGSSPDIEKLVGKKLPGVSL